MRKKRGYKREESVKLKRDYKLFAIACEGGKREPEYFQDFEFLSDRISIDIIEDIVSDDEMKTKYETKSAPKWVLDRAIKYIEKEGLIDEDELWFVLDIDRWDFAQIREIASLCENNSNWNIALSNPCFEVWLFFHKKEDIPSHLVKNCKKIKTELSKLTKTGYSKEEYIIDFEIAIKNSKNKDSNKNHFFPNRGESKVYLLAESLKNKIGILGFKKYINSFKSSPDKK